MWKGGIAEFLHIIADHAAESDFALFAHSMGGEGDIMAHPADRLADGCRVGGVKGWRDLFTTCFGGTAGVVAAQIEGDRTRHNDRCCM